MIIVILSVVTIILILFDVGFLRDDWFFAILGSFVGLILTLTFGLILCFCIKESYTLNDLDRVEIIEDKKIELSALEDTFSSQKTGFLCSVIVQDELVYNYVYKDPQYGMSVGSLDAKKCFIQYIDEADQPYIQVWHTQSKNKTINWLFCPETIYYTIYLPPNSIIENQYNIDLK